jgi:hypothetical protein
MVVSILTALGLAVVALVFARRGGDAPVHSMPALASSAIVWGGGFLQAVSVSVGAFRRDQTEGVRGLFVTRTTSLRGYLAGRIGGLAAVLAIVAAGGTLLVSLVAVAGASGTQAVTRTLSATPAALAYTLAFAAVIAPLAFAALGARSRLAGYFNLLLLLVVPEVLAAGLSSVLPSEVTELFAIPSALAALRSSLTPGSIDLFRLFRVIVALSLFGVVAAAFARRDAVLVGKETA